jgi:hypothetical protein
MSTPLTPEQIAQAQVNASHHYYLQRVLTGMDDFVNVLADGNLDETISARAQRYAAKGNEFAKLLNWGLGEIQKKHGLLANAGDLERAQEEEARAKAALGA